MRGPGFTNLSHSLVPPVLIIQKHTTPLHERPGTFTPATPLLLWVPSIGSYLSRFSSSACHFLCRALPELLSLNHVPPRSTSAIILGNACSNLHTQVCRELIPVAQLLIYPTAWERGPLRTGTMSPTSCVARSGTGPSSQQGFKNVSYMERSTSEHT